MKNLSLRKIAATVREGWSRYRLYAAEAGRAATAALLFFAVGAGLLEYRHPGLVSAYLSPAAVALVALLVMILAAAGKPEDDPRPRRLWSLLPLVPLPALMAAVVYGFLVAMPGWRLGIALFAGLTAVAVLVIFKARGTRAE